MPWRDRPSCARGVAAVATTGVVAAATALVVVSSARPAAAHSVAGGELPAPDWLLAYGAAAVVALTALALRASWTTPRLRVTAAVGPPATAGPSATAPPARPAEASRAVPRWWSAAGGALGVVVTTLLLLAAFVGPDSGASNIAPVAVFVVWWVGLPVLCLAVGDVMAVVSPFPLLVAAARPRPGAAGRAAPPWTAAAFLFAFSWFFLAYHRPGSARATGVFVVVYVVAVVAGGLRWGRAWVRTGEAFGAISSLVGRLSWRRPPEMPDPAGAAAAPLAVVWVGGTAFDAIASTDAWVDLLGATTGWTRTALNTAGLLWLVAVVAAVYLLATSLAERWAGAPVRSLAAALGPAMIPLALAWFLAHDLTLLLFEGQNFLTLLSDPIGRGWDLLGTIGDTPDLGIVTATWVRWTQVLLIVAGHAGAVVLVHDIALRRLRARRAVTVTTAMTAVAAGSAVLASFAVLGL